jgi:adenine-specific DNA methylase
VDINPVAWFILKCTLEYPQKLAGKTHPLPDFILDDGGFMEAFYKAHADIAFKAKRSDKTEGTRGLFEQEGLPAPAADLAWHVRAWGKWVLNRARRDLAKFYPTYADFEPLKPGKAYEKQSMRLVPLKDDSTPDVDSLNAEFSKEYLGDPHNPRWLAKATVAYLWARTVTCENCRATVPLLKTRWLCKKANKRVLLTMEPNVDKSGVIFGVEKDVPVKGGNAAQRREHDKLIGLGTLTQSGAKCSCCPAIMTLSDIQVAAKAHEWGRTLTAVVVDSPSGKEYRSPTDGEMEATAVDVQHALLAADPLGEPIDPTRPSPNARGLSGLTRYGITSFGDVFSRRQQAVLATLCDCIA